METKPTVPEVLPLAQALYRTARGACGCCLHAVLDDGNVNNDSVEWSAKRAREVGHADCLTLAELLLRMTRTQRLKISKQVYS